MDLHCPRPSIANDIDLYGHWDTTTVLRAGPIADYQLGTVRFWIATNFKQYTLCHGLLVTLGPDSWEMRQTDGVYFLIVRCSNAVGGGYLSCDLHGRLQSHHH